MEPYKKWRKKRHLRTIPEDIENNTFTNLIIPKKETPPPPKKGVVKTGFDNTFKIIVIGNRDSGKTTFLKKNTKQVISRTKADQEIGSKG